MYSENESNTFVLGFNAQAHAPTICVTFISMSTGKQRGSGAILEWRRGNASWVMHAAWCVRMPLRKLVNAGCYSNQADTRRIFQFALNQSILAYFGQSSSQRGLCDNLLEKDDFHCLERDHSVQGTHEPNEGNPIIIIFLICDDGVRQKGSGTIK